MLQVQRNEVSEAIAFPDLMTYSYIKKIEPQNKFFTKIRPQNKFRTKIAPLQNKFRTKIAPLQNKFCTKIKFVRHSIGKRYNYWDKRIESVAM